MIGTRPGGPIAAAWAALTSLGEHGYLELAKLALDASDQFKRGIESIPGLSLVGKGDATIVTYSTVEAAEASADPSLWARVKRVAGVRSGEPIYAIADRMEARGWTIDRQQVPASIHMTVTANHGTIVKDYLDDLVESAKEVRANPQLAKSGSAPMYGMAAKMPIRGLVGMQVRKVISDLYAKGSTPS
jgi:glutamate/tyrosine decarboxylase-like PLP-dependent enzyme